MPKLMLGKDAVVQAEDGFEVTIPDDDWLSAADVADKYMPKDAFSTELDRRVKSVTKGMVKRDELLGDEEFLTEWLSGNKDRALEVMGVDPGKPPKDIDVAELRQKIEADVTKVLQDRELKPREEKIAELTTLVGQLRERDWKASFLAAATDPDVDINEDMVEPLMHMYRSQFSYDEETDDWYKLNSDGDGYEVNVTNPEPGGSNYRTVLNVLGEERRQGKHKSWFKAPTTTGGAGYRGAKGRKAKVTYEEFKAMPAAARAALRNEDPELYKQLMQRYENEGLSALGVA